MTRRQSFQFYIHVIRRVNAMYWKDTTIKTNEYEPCPQYLHGWILTQFNLFQLESGVQSLEILGAEAKNKEKSTERRAGYVIKEKLQVAINVKVYTRGSPGNQKIWAHETWSKSCGAESDVSQPRAKQYYIRHASNSESSARGWARIPWRWRCNGTPQNSHIDPKDPCSSYHEIHRPALLLLVSTVS